MYVENKRTQPPAPDTGGAVLRGNGEDVCTVPGLEDAPLAMIYSPKQYWRSTYTPPEALDRGTLFEELFKPMTGDCRGEGGDPA